MRRLLPLLAALALPAGGAAGDLDVLITSPAAGVPLFGEVELAAEVVGDDGGAARRVELLVDGEAVAELTRPPYRLRVDLGDANREHVFEARLYGADGLLAEALLVSPAIPTDLEVDAGLQQLYVTVSRDGQRVLDLGESDFAIIDNGDRQHLVTFARGDVRLTAALLIDASGSIRGRRLAAALRGAAAFVEGMTSGDDASILAFSDQLLHATPFSSDPERLTAGLADLEATGGTALNDHLYLALKRLEARQGRRVVVLLTDGVDTHSTLRTLDVAWLVRRSRALIYWIRTGAGGREGKRFSAWKHPGQYRAERRLLERMVLNTGGRIVPIERTEEAAAAFRDILRELREQYVLGYYPTVSRDDGSWHRTQVRVSRDGLAVRSRAGYIDY